jgi:hypothetical protein
MPKGKEDFTCNAENPHKILASEFRIVYPLPLAGGGELVNKTVVSVTRLGEISPFGEKNYRNFLKK